MQPSHVDLYGPIHKALRCAAADLLTRLGATDFVDLAAAERAVAQVREVVAFYEHHLETEERFIMPALAPRLSESPDWVTTAHATQVRLTAEVEALAAAVLDAPAEARAAAGKSLYLHVSTFIAENLAHMAEEEQILAPLFDRHFVADELGAIHARILATLTPEQKAVSARWMLRALGRRERAGLVMGLLATAPRAFVTALVDVVRPTMAPDDFAALCADTGLA